MTSSSASVHSWVVIQSLPLRALSLMNLLKSRDVGKMNVARIADRFGQQFEFEIREHVEHPRRRRAGFRVPTQSLGCRLAGFR